MRLSRTYLTKETAESLVLDFVPKKFEMSTPQQAIDYLFSKRTGSDFRMNPVVEVQTGIDKIEKVDEEAKIETLALEKLAQIQQKAYEEAYQLGLQEGRQKAFDDVSGQISVQMDEFTNLLNTLANIKTEVMTYNESHMIKLLYHMASRLAQTHLEENNESMIDVIRTAVGLAQDEENITVSVAPAQLEFIEELKKQTGREFEFLKKIKFQPNDTVTPGGCIVETNYGVVDSRIQQRIQQLWESLADRMPRVKDRIAG